MSDAKPDQEPSMEEILASIRRIIADDEKPEEPIRPSVQAPSEKPPSDPVPGDVLELTQAIHPDGTVRHLPPVAETPAATPAMAPLVPLPDGRIEPEAPKTAVDSDIAMVGEPEPTAEFDSGRIVSTATSGAAAAAFARLAAVPRERRQAADILLGAGDRTLEDIVRDTLRPLLQAWLDDNLPEMVERLVRAEIARVVGEAGLR